MRCPRCESTTLDEKDRDGITIDVCKGCRGIWLDRGELEKLIARASRDLDEGRAGLARGDDRGPRYDDDDDDDRGRPGQRRKRGWFDSLGDIFD